MTIKETLQKSAKILAARKINSANLDTEIILLYILEKLKKNLPNFNSDRAWLYAHNDYKLTKKQEKSFNELLERRKKFEPIAYIVGKKEFYGISFFVNRNVLIPRPETELMVEECLKDILASDVKRKKITIADIGTGSGAIAISIAKYLRKYNISTQATIFATDISEKALKIAKKNAKINNCSENIIFKKGDLCKAIPENVKIDFLLANLPYIGEKSHQKLLKRKMVPVYRLETEFEPKKALLAGDDGLKCFNVFLRQCPKYLAKDAKIFLESDPRQIPAVKKLAKKYLPKYKITVIKDLRGLNRITKIETV